MERLGCSSESSELHAQIPKERAARITFKDKRVPKTYFIRVMYWFNGTNVQIKADFKRKRADQ